MRRESRRVHGWRFWVQAGGSCGYVRDFLRTSPDAYEITKIPLGRNVVTANPGGPSEESPYGVQYYPAD